MPRPPIDDPDIDEGLDPDGPSAADLDRFGDEMTTCRECGHRFYDQAEICPRCGAPVRVPARNVPAWAIVTAVVVLAVIALAWIL
jgi:uncharacterized paraquat-inducible protein A